MKLHIDTTLAVRIGLALVHATLGFVVNAFFPLSLFLGTKVYLGSFFVFMALIYQGPVVGASVLLAAACGAALSGDFGYCGVSILETAVSIFYYYRGERNTALVDTIFWVFGLWLVVIVRLFETYPLSEALLSGAMISVFGIAAATTASLISDLARRLPSNAKLTALLGHQRNIPFRRLVFETAAVLAIVPFLLFIVTTSISRIKGLEREVGTRLVSVSDIYSGIVPFWEEGKMARIDSISREFALGRRGAELQAMLDSMLATASDILSIGLLDDRGRILSSAFKASTRSHDNPGSDLSGSLAFKNAQSVHDRSCSLEKDAEGRPCILLVVPDTSDTGSTYVFMVFTTATLAEMLDSVVVPVKSRGWIFDPEGDIAVSSSASMPQSGTYVEYSASFRSSIEVKRGERPLLMGASRGVSSASFSQTIDAGFSPGWKALFVVDMPPLAEPVISFALALALFSFFVAAIVILVSAYASKTLVSSLEQLGSATRRFIEQFIDREAAPLVADTNIEIQWPNEGIEEVIILSRAFQEAGNLLDRRYRETLTALDTAERASRAKRDLLSAVSHDIRGPLTGIVGVAERLELDLGERRAAPAQGASDAKLIKETGMRLNSFLGELLDRSALDDGRLELRSEVFVLRGLFDSVLGVFGSSARKKGIALESEYDERLPAELVGDRARLFQILGNLVSNAIKYTERGSVKLSARLNAMREGEALIRFDVEDTGPGIASDDLARIFDPYYRVGGARASAEQGLGLGLPLARSLARLMGSDIEVQSKLGEGSRFSMSLSLKKSSFTPKPSSENFKPVSLRILLVDDEQISRNHTRRILELAGSSVIEAVDGSAAVDAALASEFDAVFMDIDLPKLDGRRAARLIREGCEKLKKKPPYIIALTGYAAQGDKESLLMSDFDDYITKAIGSETVIDALRRIGSRPEITLYRFDSGTTATDSKSSVTLAHQVDAVLDIESLLEAYKGNREFLRTLLSAFVSDGSKRLDELRSCLADAEPDDITRLLHSLVNIYGSARAQRALGLLQAWEIGLREGRYITADERDAALREAQRAIEFAQSYLESRTS